MKIIRPAKGWFKIDKVTTYDLNEVTLGNDYYIYKSYARVIQLFKNTWLSIYPGPYEVVFDNGSDIKQDFTPLLKYFDFKPVLTTIKNTKANYSVDQVHQLILNIFATKIF